MVIQNDYAPGGPLSQAGSAPDAGGADVASVTEMLVKAGVVLEVQARNGRPLCLTPLGAVAFLKNPEAVLARALGFEMNSVGLARYRQWVAWIDGHGQCTGLTRRGRRCRIFDNPQDNPAWDHPPSFRPGVDDRCSLHAEATA